MATIHKSNKPTSGTRPKRGRKPTGRHDARLDFRLSGEAKEKITKAALVTGQSLSDFAASTLVREAEQVLERQTVTTLSDRDWEIFVTLLQNPPEPDAELKSLVKIYKQHAHTEGEVTSIDASLFARISTRFGLDPH